MAETTLTMSSDSPTGIAVLRFAARQAKTEGVFEAGNLYDKDTNDRFGFRDKKRVFNFKMAPGMETFVDWEGGKISISRARETKVVGCGDLGPRKFDTVTVQSNLEKKSVQRFLVHAFSIQEEKSTKKMVSLKIFNGTFWDARGSLPKRHPDSLFIPQEHMTELFENLKRFQEDKELYHRYNIPFKYVVLLEGLPGTGKSSLAYTIASKFQRDIYIFPLTNDTDDHHLNNALASIAPGSVLVLEDVDSLFKEQSSLTKPRITLSGITNVLDGMSRIDNLWIVLTSNDVSQLPPVLLREGRIDTQIHFDYIRPTEVEAMVRKFFEERQDSPTGIDQLAAEMRKIVSKKKMVSSKCISFLFKHRHHTAQEILENHLGQLGSVEDSDKGNTLYM